MNKLANKRTSKRGQMEIMGLAVVVILVIVGITLLIRFSLTPAKQTKEKFEAGQLPETIITALEQSTTDCQEQSMANLIEDCGAFGGTIQCEPGKNSCQYTQESINGVLVELLERMLKYKYKVIKVESKGKPEEIVKKVLKERYVKENTIMVNLQNTKFFKKSKDGKYSVAS